jgi:hypothetical protein
MPKGRGLGGGVHSQSVIVARPIAKTRQKARKANFYILTIRFFFQAPRKLVRGDARVFGRRFKRQTVAEHRHGRFQFAPAYAIAFAFSLAFAYAALFQFVHRSLYGVGHLCFLLP